jgi:hypothetical protein
MSTETDAHFDELIRLPVPVKRAAYSDRTAWTMSLLSELAYMPFDEESDDRLLAIAEDLIKLATTDDEAAKSIAARLRNLSADLKRLSADGQDSHNAKLKAALAAGRFELAGGSPIYEPSTDTQAFVVTRDADDGTGMAVICFRGTQQIRDWITNVDIRAVPVLDPKGTGEIVGHFHKGFHDSYRSVHDQIAERLKGREHLPLYITGHSLGGALAVVATWYQSAQKLGACYTFGAPRVGDANLIGRFKTPIYRVVNAADPVPFVPPAGAVIDTLKNVLRVFSSIFSVAGYLDKLLEFLIKQQDFRHYGDMKYLPFNDAADPNLRLHPSLSEASRLYRYIRAWNTPTAVKDDTRKRRRDRIDKYHEIGRYREKLAAIARARNL